LKLKFFALLML